MNENRTAAWWVTSEHPEAQAWREEAEGFAFIAVVNQAYTEAQPGDHLTIPPRPIDRPPVVLPKRGDHFAIPGHKSEQPAVRHGKHFSVPQDGATGSPLHPPTGKVFSIPSREDDR